MRLDAATDFFFGLTPDRVLAAVEVGGLRCNTLCYPLNSFENRVYEVELVDGTRIIAKFYRPGRWSEEQILEEHRFLTELDAEEIPVCTVLPFPDGSTLKRIDNIFYSLAERRGGRAPDELDDLQVLRLGMLVGRIHNVGAARQAPSRPPLDADHYIRQPLAWLARNSRLPHHLEQRYFAAAEAIAKAADERSVGISRHRLHGDLHLGNLLFRDGQLRVLDFDDSATGPAVQDLWLALPGRDDDSRRQREIFLQGYQQFRLFDRRSLRLIEPLRGLRMVHFATWLARRYRDPAFKIAWPDFGTESYWQRETEDLEDQATVIREDSDSESYLAAPSGAVVVETEEAVLTNKDLFWDWEEDE